MSRAELHSNAFMYVIMLHPVQAAAANIPSLLATLV
jgi:hypothetical protein